MQFLIIIQMKYFLNRSVRAQESQGKMKLIIITFVVLVLSSCCGYDSAKADPGQSAGADTLHYLVTYAQLESDLKT